MLPTSQRTTRQDAPVAAPPGRRRAPALASLLCLGLVLACSGPKRGGQAGEGTDADGTEARGERSLTIKGSDTMVILAQKWAEAFMQRSPRTSVQVSGGGSGTGIASLINGTTTLANASRRMEPSERKQLEERRNAKAVETSVALDAIAIYVHRDNPVESLTVEQLRQAFRGRVEDWEELGVPGLGPIVLYSRENNSGTYAFFKEKVLDEHDFSAQAQTLPGTAAVINAISRDPRGIGYGGIAYAEGVREVPIRTDRGPVRPTMENAVDGTYPLARHLFIYSAGEPSGVSKDFLAFALSDAGQALVEGVGYYPLDALEQQGSDDEGATP